MRRDNNKRGTDFLGFKCPAWRSDTKTFCFTACSDNTISAIGCSNAYRFISQMRRSLLLHAGEKRIKIDMKNTPLHTSIVWEIYTKYKRGKDIIFRLQKYWRCQQS